MSLPDDTLDRPPPPARYRTIMRVEAPLTNLVGLSCRSFAELAVIRLDRPLNFGERLRYRFHGRLCSLCRNFAAQFEILNELTKEIETKTPAPAPDLPSVSRIIEKVRTAIEPGSR